MPTYNIYNLKETAKFQADKPLNIHNTSLEISIQKVDLVQR